MPRASARRACWPGLVLASAILAAPAAARADAASDTYAAMKRVSLDVLSRANPPPQMRRDVNEDGSPGPIPLETCEEETFILGVPSGSYLSGAAAVGAWRLKLDHTLRGLGLQDVARDLEDRIEGMAIADMRVEMTHAQLSDDERERRSEQRQGVYRQMSARLNQAAQERDIGGLGTPAFSPGGGCGAGDVAFRLVPSDPSVRLHIIPRFFFDTCRAEGINPMDRSICPWWAQGEGALGGAGTYRYLAEWPDGRTYSDDVTITQPQADAASQGGDDKPIEIPLPLPRAP